MTPRSCPISSRGGEVRVWGLRLSGADRCPPATCPEGSQDPTHRRYRYQGVVNEAQRAKNRVKSQIRSRVEHAFGAIKGVFHFRLHPRSAPGVFRRMRVGCSSPASSPTLVSPAKACCNLRGRNSSGNRASDYKRPLERANKASPGRKKCVLPSRPGKTVFRGLALLKWRFRRAQNENPVRCRSEAGVPWRTTTKPCFLRIVKTVGFQRYI